jgi:predicted MPP superfamily phosphohydrolase
VYTSVQTANIMPRQNSAQHRNEVDEFDIEINSRDDKKLMYVNRDRGGCCRYYKCILFILFLGVALAVAFEFFIDIEQVQNFFSSTPSVDDAAELDAEKRNSEDGNLRFRSIVNDQGRSVLRFKILQLADLHFGENPWTDWGPAQDRRSSIAIQSYIRDENPDLVILSGDQLTSKNIDANATMYHSKIIAAMLEAKPEIKWATIFGNHDDEMYRRTYDDGTIVQHDAKTSREDLVALDMAYKGSYTLQGGAPDFVSGTSNYVLFIQGDTDTDVLLNTYFFDSGGGHIAKMNHQNQITWFRNQQNQTPKIPSVAFQHIPTSEDAFAYRGNICGGPSGEGVSPVNTDSGLMQALIDDGSVHFMSVGHNHGNDYCCPANGNINSVLSLCFGRHSGHGGYSTYKDGVKWDKGARIYMMEYEEDRFNWSSYVRTENGNIEDEYQP